MAVIRTLCGRCGVGCGLRAITGEDRDLMVEGDRMHPANAGRLCGRGLEIAEEVGLEGRLLQPMIDGRPQRWEKAIAQVARRLSAVIGQHGPDSVALHVGGGLLTEDYYVANKLMKGFIGSAHVDAGWTANDGAALAQRAAYGEDVMPAAYEDIERAELILMIGADLAQDHPVLNARIAAARADQGVELLLLAAPGEGTSIEADLRIEVPRDRMASWIAGLLRHCHDTGVTDGDYLARNVSVPDDFWAQLRTRHDLWSVARSCGLSPVELRALYDRIAVVPRIVTLFGGADEGLARAVIDFHLATGRIGRPGAAPFAMTAAANGMGGREVGCNASGLAAHRGFTAEAMAEITRFWSAEAMATGPGLDGAELADAVRDGRIRALLSISGDGIDPAWLRAALDAVPLAIRSTPWADPERDGRGIALPSASWVEKDGTLTGADRLISRQRRLFPLPGEAKPDWWIVTQVARAMGWQAAFHYEWAAEIYREHVRLTAYCNDGARLLNLRRHAPISNPAYEELTPWRWGELPFDEGRFPTPDGRARLLPLS
ncbi:MAG: molybdopterin-dependent oxidoreductase [Pseudomonadota bacterium]|jgi:assimilatory nitrate reductase catalytic subunit|uniref:molybdopterin oxidoreductase family protein n=1 Tax=Sphingobium yanoikuyae TaxID=13690 RepID=UPI001377A52B|nr:molybdopterin-dependent oxidoreductase [Sphingobium yanoikuyae]NBB39678.1 molybdopterin-dependent oxidoreductase [Sphingobium yanoikuyae]